MLRNIRISWQLILSMLLIGLIPLFLMEKQAIDTSTISIKQEEFHKLAAVRQLKTNQIKDYFDNRFKDAEVLASIPMIKNVIKEMEKMSAEAIAKGHKASLDLLRYAPYATIYEQYKPYLTNYEKKYGYYDVFLFSETGRVLMTVEKEADFGTEMSQEKHHLAVLWQRMDATKNTVLSDLLPYSPSNDAPAMFIITPVFIDNEYHGAIGVQIPLTDINHIMQERTGMGKTGETYLVGMDKKMRSDSFLDKEGHSVAASMAGTVEKNGVDTKATQEAILGNSDTKIIMDYNNNPVISSYDLIEFHGVKWAIIAELDEAELLEPVERLHASLLKFMLIIGFIIIIIAIVLAWNINRGIKNVVSNLVGITSKIISGQLDTRGDKQKVGIDFALVIDNINELIDAFVKPLNVSSEYLDRLAVGDTPPKITEEYQGDFNNIMNNLNSLIEATENIAEISNQISIGNMDVTITSRSSDDVLMQSLGKLHNTIKPLLVVVDDLVKNVAKGNLESRINTENNEGAWKDLGNGINNLIEAFVKPIKVTSDYVDRISKGDIPSKITEDYYGDFNEIKNNLNQLISNLNHFIADVNNMSDQHFKGEIDIRIDESNYVGAYNDMAEGVNKMVGDHIDVITRAMATAESYAKGNFTASLDRLPGKKIFINNTLDTIKSNLLAFKDELNLLISGIQEGNTKIRGNAANFTGDWAGLVNGTNNLIEAFNTPLDVAANYVDLISKGDIPVPIEVENYKGDFKIMAGNFNTCIIAINRLIKDADFLSEEVIKRRLRSRADETQHSGDFKKIIAGVNFTLDAFCDIFDNLSLPIMAVDNDLNIQFMNKTGAELGETTGKALEGSKCYDFMKTDNCGTDECACSKAMQINGNVNQETIARPGNKILDIKYSASPIKDRKGNIIGSMEVVQDQTAIKKALSEAEQLTMDVQLQQQEVELSMHKSQKISQYQTLEADKLTKGLSKLANGNFDFRLSAEEPDSDTQEVFEVFDNIANAVNSSIDAINELALATRDIAIETGKRGNLEFRADRSKHHGEFGSIVGGFNDVLDAILAPVDEARRVVEIMATGDLTPRITTEYEGDHEKLKDNINILANSLSDLISQVLDGSETLASAVLQITSTIEDLAAASQESTAQTDEVASAVEEMSKTITDNAEGAQNVSKMAEENGDVAKDGGSIVKQTVEKMRDIAEAVNKSAQNIGKLGDSSQEIGEIISVIDDIADQTNLLALNAAIEAARAGEQGRGFAVVADEVRKLAERTTDATKQIAGMIRGIQTDTSEAVEVMNKGNQEVSSGIELADRAGDSLNEIVASTSNVQQAIDSIASANEEQSATSEQIAKNVSSISQVSNESTMKIQEISSTCEDLSKLTDNLQSLIQQFKVTQNNNMFGGDHQAHLLTD